MLRGEQRKISMLFSEYVEMWKKEAIGNRSESYMIDQERTFRLHILPILGSKNIYKMTSGDISEVMNKSKELGHSPATREYIYTSMHKAFHDAIEFFELEIKNPVKKRYHKPKAVKTVAAFMPPEESTVVLDYTMGSLFESLIWIQLLCGVRVSEVLPLKWKNIDFRNNMIVIDTVFVRKTGKLKPYSKNGSQFYVPMPPRLAKFLAERMRDPEEFVAPNTKNEMICYYVFRRYLRKLKEKLNLKVRSSHGLRHSSTELWYEAGASIQDIGRLLNHNSEKSTLVYVHRTNRRLAELSKNVGNPFDSGCIIPEKKVVNE
jgi:integrase